MSHLKSIQGAIRNKGPAKSKLKLIVGVNRPGFGLVDGLALGQFLELLPIVIDQMVSLPDVIQKFLLHLLDMVLITALLNLLSHLSEVINTFICPATPLLEFRVQSRKHVTGSLLAQKISAIDLT